MRTKTVVDCGSDKRSTRTKRKPKANDCGAEASEREGGVTFTIERRYIGKLTGGLLDRWHAPWQQWHVWLSFKSEKDRDQKLREISQDEGWHVDNFEYRAAQDGTH